MTSTLSRPRLSSEHEDEPAIERVPWSVIGPEFIAVWGQPRGKVMPEHLEILGPTGSGKSYLLVDILKERARRRKSAIIYIVTKQADDTVESAGRGHERVLQTCSYAIPGWDGSSAQGYRAGCCGPAPNCHADETSLKRDPLTVGRSPPGTRRLTSDRARGSVHW